ncbi:MAG: hypothetical protein Q8N03_13615 [Ignavibacteria bacterium]|nr:hypothetical protein [Ignavibacteria bacterium]
MNKIKFLSFVLFILILNGCEPDLSGVINPIEQSYRVKTLSSINEYNYNPLDSFLTVSVEFVTFDQVSSVYCNIYGPDQKKINNSLLYLLDNGNSANGDVVSGDGKFSNKIPFSEVMLNGNYRIEYFVLDKSNYSKQIGEENFLYNNGQTNIAPIIDNVRLPSEILRGVSFVFSVDASDPNGLSDLASVYFELKRPDGTMVEASPGFTKFSMYDNGNVEIYGDTTANDGRFSFKNSFLDTTTTQTGSWEFKFQARDRGNKLSNQITQTILVQ